MSASAGEKLKGVRLRGTICLFMALRATEKIAPENITLGLLTGNGSRCFSWKASPWSLTNPGTLKGGWDRSISLMSTCCWLEDEGFIYRGLLAQKLNVA